MTDKISIFDALRMTMLTDGTEKQRAAAIVKMLFPLIREDAMVTPEQSAHLVTTIVYSFVKKNKTPDPMEITALVAFANNGG